MTYNEYLNSNDRRKRVKIYDKISLRKKDNVLDETKEREDN